MGDLLGLKGVVVNFMVRKIRKMVPAYSLPGAIWFKDCAVAGRKMTLKKPFIGPNDVAFLQIHGRHNGRSKGATLLHRNMVGMCFKLKRGLIRPHAADWSSPW